MKLPFFIICVLFINGCNNQLPNNKYEFYSCEKLNKELNRLNKIGYKLGISVKNTETIHGDINFYFEPALLFNDNNSPESKQYQLLTNTLQKLTNEYNLKNCIIK